MPQSGGMNECDQIVVLTKCQLVNDHRLALSKGQVLDVDLERDSADHKILVDPDH